ncbi:hypothetical protein RQN30_08395 [Arcanobacterium hippocoleae]
MTENIRIHKRIQTRHPELSEEEIISAWKHPLAMRYRNYDQPVFVAAAGSGNSGRLIEMLGVIEENDSILIFHAMELTKKMAKELNLYK